MICKQASIHFWYIPSRNVRMDSIHKCGIILHFRRQRSEQVADSLLMLDIHIKITHKNKSAICTNALFTAAELSGFHIPFHDIYTVFLIKGYAGDLVKTDNIILADKTALTRGIIDKHLCNSGFPAGNKVCIRRNLLIKMTFARTARSKFNHVVVALNKRNHPQYHGILSPLIQSFRFDADAAEQKQLPLLCGKLLPPLNQGFKNIST